jgi:hypothetical protein
LRDLDDLTASFLEVLTCTGRYYWVGWEQIERLTFEAERGQRIGAMRQVTGQQEPG